MVVSSLAMKNHMLPCSTVGERKRLKTQPATEKLGEYIKKEIFFNKENSFLDSDPRSPPAPSGG
jgi:hypothetical protein